VNALWAARLAMPVAGFMIAHHVAARAIRDAAFLGAWPVSSLPAMVIATSLLVVGAVPVYSRLLDRFGPRAVVSLGFLVSAAIHVLEWRLWGASPWVTVAIYLHVAGLSILLLSGFWSLVSELFDPKAARQSYGRIAAAGTIGGLAGGLAAAQSGTTLSETGALLMLAVLHGCCAFGVFVLGQGRVTATEPARADASSSLFEFRLLRGEPHLRTLALIVVLGTAGAAIADYLLKMAAVEPQNIGTHAGLRQFFAAFYLVVQLATFLAQFLVASVVRRFGLGRTIATLPAGVGAMATLGLLYPVFPIYIGVRGLESVLRGSFFRSAYELIFVPMEQSEKNRAKTFLDVTCDRIGDAVGAGVVQLILLLTALMSGAAAYLSAQLLAVVIGMAAWSLWLASRLDALYLGVVERRLTAHGDATPIVVGSETGWTVLDLAQVERPPRAAADAAPVPPAGLTDAKIRRLADLRSGDRGKVERTLAQLTRPDSLEIAQVVQLLAWDDLVPSARRILEAGVASHVGLLTDVLLDPETDFAIRRRVPRILGTLPERRALEGLLSGLDDARFEVRYQCSRAIHRLVSRHGLTVDAGRVLAAVEREVSVPPQIWHGHRLIDHVDREDDPEAATGASPQEQRNLEHVFSLLAVVLPPEPLTVALQGIRSVDAGLRGVAIEYLESVLPPHIWARLWLLLDPGIAPGSERTSDEAADKLKLSAEILLHRQQKK
jgi:hypothetical protein